LHLHETGCRNDGDGAGADGEGRSGAAGETSLSVEPERSDGTRGSARGRAALYGDTVGTDHGCRPGGVGGITAVAGCRLLCSDIRSRGHGKLRGTAGDDRGLLREAQCRGQLVRITTLRKKADCVKNRGPSVAASTPTTVMTTTSSTSVKPNVRADMGAPRASGIIPPASRGGGVRAARLR
jgi:hypothetical protein